MLRIINCFMRLFFLAGDEKTEEEKEEKEEEEKEKEKEEESRESTDLS